MPWKCTDVTRHTASWGLTQSTKITRAVRADRGGVWGGENHWKHHCFQWNFARHSHPAVPVEAMVLLVRSMPWIVPVEVQVLPVQEKFSMPSIPKALRFANPRHSRVRVPLEMMVRGFVSTGKLCISNSAWQHCMANNFNIFCNTFISSIFVMLSFQYFLKW